MAMRFGVFVPQGWRMDLTEIADPEEKYETMTQVARLVDATPQYDSVWLYDHFHTIPTAEPESVFEAWTTTAALSRDTKRVNIGQMVTCNGYRSPALLAKMASTVDTLSHGRLYCGLGAGWYEHEWLAYGYGFPETRQRMRSFREACAVMMKMWTEEAPEFSGEYYQIDKPINEPRGVRKPHPSFWIGGDGEQVTLKLVAQYADACNFAGDQDFMRHKYDVLRRHCETLGRDYESITRSTIMHVYPIAPGADAQRAREQLEATYSERARKLLSETLVGDPDAIARVIDERAAVGANYFIFYIPRIAYEREPYQRLTDLLAARYV
ncbi:MAG: LLM class F420-dependent oxidoreductase [Chloroflexota bacterium]|nr:LLM class F420-dependent oxidoreductase [Chloroflexota bacterium]